MTTTRIDYNLLRELTKDRNTPPEVTADFLSDQGADLATMLHLFGGAPPTWTQGISRAVLTCWLRVMGDARCERIEAIEQKDDPGCVPIFRDGERGRLAAFAGYFPELVRDNKKQVPCPGRDHDGGIATVVTLTYRYTMMDNLLDRRLVYEARCPLRACNERVWALTDRGPDVRKLKRAILGMFPDVQVTALRTCDCGSRPRRVDKRCSVCNGTGVVRPGDTVAASELIPQENKRW